MKNKRPERNSTLDNDDDDPGVVLDRKGLSFGPYYSCLSRSQRNTIMSLKMTGNKLARALTGTEGIVV